MKSGERTVVEWAYLGLLPRQALTYSAGNVQGTWASVIGHGDEVVEGMWLDTQTGVTTTMGVHPTKG